MIRRRVTNIYTALVFTALAVFSQLSQAVPFASFTGDIFYTTNDQKLVANGFVISTDNVSAEFSDLLGSDVTFTSFLDTVTTVGNLTVAEFLNGGSSLNVTSSSGDLLIDAVLSDITLTGINSTNFGIYEADFLVTGGSFASHFVNENQLFSLVFNLNQAVSEQMFSQNFTGSFAGDMNGRLEFSGLAVAEPNSISLFILGFIALMVVRREFPRYMNWYASTHAPSVTAA